MKGITLKIFYFYSQPSLQGIICSSGSAESINAERKVIFLYMEFSDRTPLADKYSVLFPASLQSSSGVLNCCKIIICNGMFIPYKSSYWVCNTAKEIYSQYWSKRKVVLLLFLHASIRVLAKVFKGVQKHNGKEGLDSTLLPFSVNLKEQSY